MVSNIIESRKATLLKLKLRKDAYDDRTLGGVRWKQLCLLWITERSSSFHEKTEIIYNKTRLWMASPNYSAVRRQHLIYYENGSETTKMIHDLLKIKISWREKYEKASISCKGIRPYQAPIRNKGLDALDWELHVEKQRPRTEQDLVLQWLSCSPNRPNSRSEVVPRGRPLCALHVILLRCRLHVFLDVFLLLFHVRNVTAER